MQSPAVLTEVLVTLAVVPEGGGQVPAPVRHRFGPQQQQISVGADGFNDIVLDAWDDTVSGQHLVLLRHAASSPHVLLRDLASLNDSWIGASRDQARPFQQVSFDGQARVFVGCFQLDITVAAEQDPWDRLVFARPVQHRPRPEDEGTCLDDTPTPQQPPWWTGLADERQDLMRRISRLRQSGVDRVSALQVAAEALATMFLADAHLLRVQRGRQRVVLPPDAGPLSAPVEGGRAMSEGRRIVEGSRLIVPIWDAAGGATRIIGDATIVRDAGAPFGDADARFVEQSLAWLLAGSPEQPAASLPSAAVPWPLPLVGVSPAHRRTMRLIDDAAASRARAVWLEGPTGSGKSFIAALIHRRDPHARGAFESVSCGTTDALALNTEIFGLHSPNDRSKRKGKLAQAHHGTLLLDEVHALTRPLQDSLKAALGDTRTSIVSFTPVAGNAAQTADVRIVAATTVARDSDEGRRVFDDALLRRLVDVCIRVESLDERPEDLPLLVLKLLDEMAAAQHMPPASLSPAARQMLCRRRWPENLAGLYKVLRAAFDRAVARAPLADGRGSDARRGVPVHVALDLRDFDAEPGQAQQESASRTAAEAELDLLLQALEQTRGHAEAAARALGLSKQTIYDKLDEWCVPRRHGRPRPTLGSADEAVAARLRDALEAAARGQPVPPWLASPQARTAFHQKALTTLAGLADAPSSVDQLRRRLDELWIPRCHPGTPERVRQSRRPGKA